LPRRCRGIFFSPLGNGHREQGARWYAVSVLPGTCLIPRACVAETVPVTVEDECVVVEA